LNLANLTGQVVLVNGAGRGPGPLMTETFARAGAVVAAVDLSPILLDPLVERVRSAGGQIRTYIGDFSRGMPARSLLDEIMTDWERVDVLINNPRVSPHSSVLKMDEWDWHHTLDLNLSGAFLLTQFVGRLMVEQGGGVMINLLAADSPDLHAAGRAAYAASQAGLLALSHSAARELIAYNIRIYALCLDDAVLNVPSMAVDSAPGSPANSLSELALFLCSPAAAHLPGQVFRIASSSQEQEAPASPAGTRQE
jgi:NAD(P)-dependent dehydrogenase (short-subunit alcohol dehydrogenase family)